MERLFTELSKEVESFIASAIPLQEWPECRQLLLDMLGDNEPWVHALPILSCQAAGGNRIDAFPVAASWLALLHAANLIDDIQDGDLARLPYFEKPETAVAIALAWVFFAFRMLDDSSLSPDTRYRVSDIFTRTGINSSKGQFQDLTPRWSRSDGSDMLAAYWEMVINKSGSIFMAGAAGGAAAGTAQTLLIEALGDYGTALGVVRQVLDDCRDLWIDTKNSPKKTTLPLILQELITGDKLFHPPIIGKQVENTSWSNEQTYCSLTEAGVPDIIADVLLEWRRRAIDNLQILKPSDARDALVYIFEYAMKPKPHNI